LYRLLRLLEDLPEEVLHARSGGGGDGVNTVALSRGDEVVGLVALLFEHGNPAVSTPDDIGALAERVACGCLGDNHLWQDLELASRAELSALMRNLFPTLVASSSQEMTWKKFRYRELCQRENILFCKSPSCAV
jgi:nitrogen fixation protein NifQ